MFDWKTVKQKGLQFRRAGAREERNRACLDSICMLRAPRSVAQTLLFPNSVPPAGAIGKEGGEKAWGGFNTNQIFTNQTSSFPHF